MNLALLYQHCSTACSKQTKYELALILSEKTLILRFDFNFGHVWSFETIKIERKTQSA